MTKIQNLKDKTKKLNKVFEENDVVLAYLFGSAARGQLTILSDIDIAILFSDKVLKNDYFDKELHLTSEIGRIFKIEQVDIINLKTVRNPLLKHRAVFRGKPIFVKDKKLQFAIEREILQEYEDTKYLRRVAYEIMRRQLKEGIFGKPLISPNYSKRLSKYVNT